MTVYIVFYQWLSGAEEIEGVFASHQAALEFMDALCRENPNNALYHIKQYTIQGE